jgi:hypothetical protein
MIKLFRPKRAVVPAESEEPVATSPSAPEPLTPADPPLPVTQRRPREPKVYIARPEFGPDPSSGPPSMRQAYLSRGALRPDAKPLATSEGAAIP